MYSPPLTDPTRPEQRVPTSERPEPPPTDAESSSSAAPKQPVDETKDLLPPAPPRVPSSEMMRSFCREISPRRPSVCSSLSSILLMSESTASRVATCVVRDRLGADFSSCDFLETTLMGSVTHVKLSSEPLKDA